MCGGGSRVSTGSGRRPGEGRTGQETRDEEPDEGDTETEDPCEINERTDLSNIDPDVLDEINIGDIFPIEPRDNRLCVVDFEGQIIGSILGPLANRLEECIDQGRDYKAEIIDITGRSCNVRVTNKCPLDNQVMLSSPDPDVLSDVSEGDELEVAVREDVLCVVDESDQIVGSLAMAWTGVIIQCIDSGWSYSATVDEIDGGDCRVRVTGIPPTE
mgnify:CR=1 FL=1